MIIIEDTEVFGWRAAIRGVRNAKNSWSRSDTVFYPDLDIGPRDLRLLTSLSKGRGSDRKYLRCITIYTDIVAMQPWWQEFDTYKVGTVRNSCSKMHKIHDKQFSGHDFTHDGIDEVDYAKDAFISIVATCERLRQDYKATGEYRYWRALIELLPEGYCMRATVKLNYEVLRAMYHDRKFHKLTEWREFCKWIESLPYSELITGQAHEDEEKQGRDLI